MGTMRPIRNTLRFGDDIRQRYLSLEKTVAVAHFCTFTNYRASFGPQPTECIPSEKCLLEFQPGVSVQWKYECSEWTTPMK